MHLLYLIFIYYILYKCVILYFRELRVIKQIDYYKGKHRHIVTSLDHIL